MLRGEELDDGGGGRFLDLVMMGEGGSDGDVGDGAVVLEVFGEVHDLIVTRMTRWDIKMLLGNVSHLHTSELDVGL